MTYSTSPAAASTAGSAKLRAVLFDMDDTLLDWSGASAVIGGKQHRLTPLANVYQHVVREVYSLAVTEDQFQQTALDLIDQSWLEAKQGQGAPHIGRTLVKTLELLGVPADKARGASIERSQQIRKRLRMR